MTIRAAVEPAIFRWARETAGLSIEDAARRVPVKPERLSNWEEGGAQPTMSQLRSLANIYKRPISVFFLPAPPAEPPVSVHDFRQLPGQDPGVFSSALLLQLRRGRERRQLALDLMTDLELAPAHLDLAADLDSDPEELGFRLREVLGVDADTQAQWKRPYDALNSWRSRIEAAGALVFQMSRVDLSEARGFSLAEDVLPVIAVNSQDTPNARAFTMLHEMCHVVLRRSGVCEPDEVRLRPSEERRVEFFCNHVAGAALLPMDDLLNHAMVQANAEMVWPEESLATLSKRFSVSRFVVLRRLLAANRTTSAFYQQKHDQWLAEQRARLLKKPEKEGAGGGPSPDRLAVAEKGQAFVRLVLQSYYADRITLSNVSEYLGVRLKHLSKIEHAVGL